MSENDLIVAETLRADVVFAPGGVDVILQKLERDVRAVRTDISTRAGRAACASLARKVASSKTALDDLGKGLVADWKLRSALVDAERRRIRDRLDALRDEVRQPLTEWEGAERRRVLGHEQFLAWMLDFTKFDAAEPAAEFVSRRIDEFEAIKPREWHEFAQRAAETAAQVRRSLQASLEAAVRREVERAELARLRAEDAERKQRERDERLRREAAEKARAAAEAEARQAAQEQAAREAAERARVDRERVAAEEARRVAQAAAEKAAQALAAAEEKARRDAEAAQRAHDEAKIAAAASIEKAKREAEAAERRRADDERAAASAATARREADLQNKERVHEEIVDDLVRRKFSQKQAWAIVAALASGAVPHVRIAY